MVKLENMSKNNNFHKRKRPSIVFLAGRHVTRRLIKELPSDLLFHNLHHTMNVVRGVREIIKYEKVDKVQQEILFLAAWFHDTGFIHCYQGHEQESQHLATAFLEQQNYPLEKIALVVACIQATKMPQAPANLLEQIICDADLYHLSLPEYYHLQKLLLEEWKRVFKKTYTDQEWAKENCVFLQHHHYWTAYGRTVLRDRKALNLEKCQQALLFGN